LTEENREQQHWENQNIKINVDTQYNRFAEDWRHVNTIIWQLPSIAISIMGGIVAVAYNFLEDWPRIMLLSTGSLFMFVLTIVVARQIDFANTRFRFLQYIEYKCHATIFPTGLHDDLKKIESKLEDMPLKELTFNPYGGDHMFKLLSRQSSRKWLMYSILILSIVLAGGAVNELYMFVIR
jgi:hypothetical protein